MDNKNTKAHSINTTASENDSKNVSSTTNRVEELWAVLLKAWPAVKNNPEIAEKIETLWSILKTSSDRHIELNKEMQNLISNKPVTPALSASLLQKSSNTKDNENIDSLLAEILGDDYKQDITHSFSQTNDEENQSITNKSSGTEELDKMVASILGEDWLKEDPKNIKTIQENTNTSESNDSIIVANQNIDNVVSTIIGNEPDNETTIPTSADINKTINNTEAIDTLLNDILNEDDRKEKLTDDNKLSSDDVYDLNADIANYDINKTAKNEDTEVNIDDLIKDITDKETNLLNSTSNLSNITNNDQAQATSFDQEESIDDLIKDITDKETNLLNTASSLSNIDNNNLKQATSFNQEESIDDLISDITNVDVTNKEENVDDLINDIINRDSITENITSDSNDTINDEQKPASELSQGDLDTLINNIVDKEDNTATTAPDSNNITSEENIDALISDVTSYDVTNDDVTNEKENIDDLINDIMNKDSIAENITSDSSDAISEEQKSASELSQDDLDTLINDIVNKEDSSATTAPDSNNITSEENIDDLINEILIDKPKEEFLENTKPDETQKIDISNNLSSNNKGKKDKKAKSTKFKEPTLPLSSYRQTKNKSSFTLLTVSFIILLLGFFGMWRLFFSNDKMTTENALTNEQYTAIMSADDDVSSVDDEPVAEESLKDLYTESTRKENKFDTLESQYAESTIDTETSYPESEQTAEMLSAESITPDSTGPDPITSENVTSETNTSEVVIPEAEYSAQIENDNNNDITITLNTPETAIDINSGSNLLNKEVIATTEIASLIDDKITTTENVVEDTSPTETLSESELVLKESKTIKIEKAKNTKTEKPTKTKTKTNRNVIIHTIVKGDTLWAIAKRYVNNPYRYPELAKLSKIRNPDRIYPGNKVKIIIYTK